MFSLAFHAFLRIGEITTKCASNAATVIQRSNIHFQFSNNVLTGLSLFIRHFKHSDLQGKTLLIKAKNTTVCPVLLLKAYLDIAHHTEGPLYQFPDAKPVSYSYFSTQLKNVLSFAGFNPQFYKSHSFRIGAASVCAANGVPELSIRQFGRWKSDATKNYIRINFVQP